MKKILSAAILVGVFVAGMLVASIPSSTPQAEAAQDDAAPQSLVGRLASVDKVLGKINDRLNSINSNVEPGGLPPESAPVLDSIQAQLAAMKAVVDTLQTKIGP